MDSAKLIFETFNMAVSMAYDDYISAKGEEALKDISEGSDELNVFLGEREEQWAGKKLDELGGKSPADFFMSFDSLDDLLALLETGVKICDDKLPGMLTDKLHLYGNEAVIELLKLAEDLSPDDEDFLVSVSAIRLLGQWKCKSAARRLIELLLGKFNENVLVMEEIRNALVSIGTKALPELSEAFVGFEPSSEAYEYLLMALAAVGHEKKDDKIYSILKNCFLKMENKPVGAACLAEYGDGRAIPALRGYVEKNLSTIDKFVYYDIKSAIEKLGGNINDLKKK